MVCKGYNDGLAVAAAAIDTSGSSSIPYSVIQMPGSTKIKGINGQAKLTTGSRRQPSRRRKRNKLNTANTEGIGDKAATATGAESVEGQTISFTVSRISTNWAAPVLGWVSSLRLRCTA